MSQLPDSRSPVQVRFMQQEFERAYILLEGNFDQVETDIHVCENALREDASVVAVVEGLMMIRLSYLLYHVCYD